jgi:hypothetical protein
VVCRAVSCLMPKRFRMSGLSEKGVTSPPVFGADRISRIAHGASRRSRSAVALETKVFRIIRARGSRVRSGLADRRAAPAGPALQGFTRSGIARRAERSPQFESHPIARRATWYFRPVAGSEVAMVRFAAAISPACQKDNSCLCGAAIGAARGSHFSVAASLVGGAGRLGDQPALRDLAPKREKQGGAGAWCLGECRRPPFRFIRAGPRAAIPRTLVRANYDPENRVRTRLPAGGRSIRTRESHFDKRHPSQDAPHRFRVVRSLVQEAFSHLTHAASRIGARHWAKQQVRALVDGPCDSSRKHFQSALAQCLARCSEEPVGD